MSGQQRYAKLVRGQTYTYGGKVYRSGVWVKVANDVIAHLQEHAEDHVTVLDGQDTKIPETRQKFEFGIGTDMLDPDEFLVRTQQEQKNAAGAVAPRSRSRLGGG